MPDSALPSGFESLSPFVAVWAVDSAAKRDALRSERRAAERSAFFEAARDLVAPALALLDKKPLRALDAHEKRLLSLMLSFAHVSLAEEIQRDHEPRHAAQRRHLPITTAPGDRALT